MIKLGSITKNTRSEAGGKAWGGSWGDSLTEMSVKKIIIFVRKYGMKSFTVEVMNELDLVLQGGFVNSTLKLKSVPYDGLDYRVFSLTCR